MINIINYNNVASLTDYNLSVVLKTIADEWKLDSSISLGWSILKCGRECHFVSNTWLAKLCIALDNKGFLTCVECQTIGPVNAFEEWNLPNNQEEGMMRGYIDTPEDFDGIKPLFYRNPFGAWRVNSPVI